MKHERKAFVKRLIVSWSVLCFLLIGVAGAESLTSDIVAGEGHEPIKWELIRMVEHDPH